VRESLPVDTREREARICGHSHRRPREAVEARNRFSGEAQQKPLEGGSEVKPNKKETGRPPNRRTRERVGCQGTGRCALKLGFPTNKNLDCREPRTLRRGSRAGGGEGGKNAIQPVTEKGGVGKEESRTVGEMIPKRGKVSRWVLGLILNKAT